MAHGTRPLAAELAFGLPKGALGPVALELPDGRHVQFRGQADRVDVAADGTLHVVDYKTGKADDYKDLSEDNPDDRGRRLQLPVYGQAARQSQGTPTQRCRPNTGSSRPGAASNGSGTRSPPTCWSMSAPRWAPIVAGIEAGVFPHHPTASSTTPWVECPFCDPDGMGVTELRRQYERKQADPAMAAFVDLVDPAPRIPLDAEGERLPDA